MTAISTPSAKALVQSAIDLSPRTRLLLILFNYIPFMNVLIVVTLCVLAGSVRPRWTWVLPPMWLLLIPPIVVRLTPRAESETDVSIGSPMFLRWWFTAQWQVIFNRLPWIEELI